MPDPRNLSKKNSRRGNTWRLAILLFVLVFIAAIGALIFLNGDKFVLQTIEISGNKQLSSVALAAAAREAMAGRRAWFFNRDHYWFYSPEQLAAVLAARFGRLASIDVQTPDWRTLQIKVTERQTVALWCPDPSIENEDCFYLDETGLAFARAPHFSTPPLVVIIGAIPSATSTLPTLKSQPLPRSVFSDLLAFKSSLEKFFPQTPFGHIAVRQIEATNDGDYKFHLANWRVPESDFDLSITRTQTTAEILNLLKSVLTVPVFTTELTLGTKLEYLDLRFGRKIFYRFRE